MGLRLIIEDDEGSTTIVPLGADPVTIGRHEGNTIRLTEQNVSRQHARLHPQAEGWVLEDLGSYNGVRVNGYAIEGRVLLREGDIVQIGDYHLALTEDVEKSALNLERPVVAANDGEQPLLASSSTDLPRLSPQEIAQLQAELARDNASPEMAGSIGSSAATRQEPIVPMADPADDEDTQGGTPWGLIVGGGVAVAAVLAAFLFVGGGEDAEADRTGALAQNGAVDASAGAPAVPGVGLPGQPDGAAAPVGEEEEVVLDDEEPELVEDEPGAPTARKRSRKKRRRRRAPRDAAPEPTPEADPEPAPAAPAPPEEPPAEEAPKRSKPSGDPDQLLADARKASLTGNPSQAYSLAKKSYAIKRSASALEVMGVSACKMGDEGKAKSAYRKLTGGKKQTLARICAGKGITLD